MTDRNDHARRMRPFDRIGVRFLAAMLAVLGVVVVMVAIAAQSMVITDNDQRLLMRVLVPAVLGAALVAMLMARPVARDASKICDVAMRVADGDLSARTGVVRSDELGEAAAMFDKMVDRLDAIESERAVMLSSISHDLRTPLAALRASVEAIRDGIAPDPDAYLSGMERQIKALASLVDDLQLHSRIVSGTIQTIRTRLDLTELADEAMETLRPLAETRRVALLLEADERVNVDADGSQLARVIRNLLENAIRHAPHDSAVLVQVAASSQSATLRVVDQGAGFPPDFRERAFEPFTRADPARDLATGTVRISTSEVAAVWLMPAVLARLQTEEPGIQIELVASNAITNLLRREADIAVRMMRPAQGSLVARKLGEIGITACAHRSYLQRAGTPRKPTDLLHHRLIGYDRDDTIERGFAKMGLALSHEAFALRTDNQLAYGRLVAAGAGIGFVADYNLRHWPGGVPLLPMLKIPPLPCWLAVHREIRGSALVRRVYEFLAAAIPAELAR